METFIQYIEPVIDILNEMTPYILLGFLIAGILHEFVPRRIYASKLSGNNLSSVVWAALFGIPLPLCSCGVIPTAASLRREGASKGATVSFLISTPQTGVDSILATASLFGVPFAILRPVVAFVTAIAGGYAVNRLQNDDKENATACHSGNSKKSFLQKCRDALYYGFVEMVQDIGKWVLAGLAIAAVITAILPDDFFVQFGNYPLLNMLVILVVSVPMYLCATGSIPIAAALMLKGLSPGAALVLLMAGPATNMAAILVINRTLGRKPLIVYLLSIIIGAISFGLLIDYALPAEWFSVNSHCNGDTCHHAMHTPWWQAASSILFMLLLVIAYTLKLRKKEKGNTAGQSSFRINGMMCNHCKANVEKNLAAIEGVKEVHVVLEEGRAYIDGSGYDRNTIISTIKELGYEYIED